MKRKAIWLAASVVVVAALLIGGFGCAKAPTPAPAEEKIPPDMIIFSAYEPGGTIYQELASIGSAIKDEYGTDVRILPFGDDVARLLAITTGKAQFGATGAGWYYAAEGLAEFSDLRWGPQPLSLIWQVPGSILTTWATTKESGIVTPYDLKGKRVGQVAGSPSLNTAMEAWLAFGNLTWDDVEVSTFAGWRLSIDGLIEGKVDAVFGWGTSGHFNEVAASPRGLHWVELPHADKEGWARMQQILPYIVPLKATSEGEAIGASESNPIEGGAYASPVIAAYPDQVSEEVVYFVVKAFDELYPKYKGMFKPLETFVIEDNLLAGGIAPYHAGVVKYLKDKGLWTDAHQTFQEKMTARQQLLLETWEAAVAEGTQKGLTSSKISELWLEKRQAVLKANFPVYPGILKYE